MVTDFDLGLDTLAGAVGFAVKFELLLQAVRGVLVDDELAFRQRLATGTRVEFIHSQLEHPHFVFAAIERRRQCERAGADAPDRFAVRPEDRFAGRRRRFRQPDQIRTGNDLTRWRDDLELHVQVQIRRQKRGSVQRERAVVDRLAGAVHRLVGG